MPPRRKAVRYVPPEDRPAPNLRFKPQGKGHWKPGYFICWRPEGTIDLSQTFNGASRCIAPEFVEFKGTGPRGGTTWERAVRPMVPPDA